MSALKGYDSLARFDMFSEPNHDKISKNYWHNGEIAFSRWAKAVAAGIINVTSHPLTMGSTLP